MLTKNDKKRIQSLHLKKYRKQHKEFFIEGFRLVSSAIDNDNQRIKCVYVTEDFLSLTDRAFIRQLKEKKISLSTITESDMNNITDTVHSSGVAAVCCLSENQDGSQIKLNPFLFLDRINDPGNLGTLLRTALWLGVRHIILSEDCVDPFNPKVVRAGMGAHFSVSLHQGLNLADLQNTHIILGGGSSGIPISELPKLSQPWGLVIGSEAHGISEEITQQINQFVSIPKRGEGESLNAAMAGSILLYELTIQNP